MRPGSREMSTPNLPFPKGTTGGSGLGRSRQGFSRKINQPVADRVDDQLGGLVGSQSVHHVGAMYSYGIGAEVERGRNLFIGLAIDDHLQNFEFARSKPGAAAALERGRTLELGVEHRLAVRDSPDGGAQLQVNRIFQYIAARTGLERLPHQRLLRMH